ncbi:MAG: hypothetical protein JNK82_08000 [Myxococcaceae bacterium]|nr:hypothetical protein [Myxococcaceae bacterium]
MRGLTALFVVASIGACKCDNVKSCSTDDECGPGARCTEGICVVSTATAGGGGATAGGGSTTAGGGTGGSGGTGGGSAMAGGGQSPALSGLVWHEPDAGIRVRTTSVSMRVSAVPTGADAGTVLYGAVLIDGGSPRAGMLSPQAGNVFTGQLAALVDGTWRVTASSGSLDASVLFTIDSTGPALIVEQPAVPDYGMNTADFLPTDPAGAAFRKDERVRVRVTSPDLDLATVQLTARYADAGVLTPAAPTDCSTSSFACREFTVDLSQIDLPMFGGDVIVTATGADDLMTPHRSSMPATLKVTRWQWARRIGQMGIGGSLRSTPAIGAGGRVFVPIANGINTGVAGLNADGGLAWPSVADSSVTGTIAVGRGMNGEYVFFQPSTALSTGTIKTVNAATGVVDMSRMCGGGGTGSANEAGVALFSENTTTVAGIGVQADTMDNRGRVLQVEPNLCREASSSTLRNVLAPGNLVATASSALTVGSNGNLRVFDYTGTMLSLRSIDQSVGGIGVVNGLAMLTSTRIAGGGGGGPGIGRIFAFDITATAATNAWDAGAPLSTPTSGPVAGAQGVVASIRSATDKVQVIRLSATNGAELARSRELAGSAFMGTAAPSPVLGSGGKTYVVDQNGRLFVMPSAFTSDAGQDWSAPLPAAVAGSVSASPTLDCNRRISTSQTGVLYLATESGWVVTYLVDSPGGLETGAVWPKYARDARNTGNFDGPPIGCP